MKTFIYSHSEGLLKEKATIEGPVNLRQYPASWLTEEQDGKEFVEGVDFKFETTWKKHVEWHERDHTEEIAVPLKQREWKHPMTMREIMESEETTERCGICGGELVLIRGIFPGTENRSTCPTCTTERLEQINEISSKEYGKAYNTEPKTEL